MQAASDFVRTHTAIASPPLLPELRLHMATEITPLWHATQAQLDDFSLPPPYWAFCWAGGQALARFVLDHPDHLRGRKVLDFACGSGVVGLAAAKAGAACVDAADIDNFALAAVQENAALNGVAISLLSENVLTQDPTGRWQVILAGDVCYEQPFADAAITWLRRQSEAGALVLLADPGRSYLPKNLTEIGRYLVPTSLDLEATQSRETVIYRL